MESEKQIEITVIVELFSTFANTIFSKEPEKEKLLQYLGDFKKNIYNNSDSLKDCLNFFDQNPLADKKSNSSLQNSGKSANEKYSNSNSSFSAQENMEERPLMNEMLRNCESIENDYMMLNDRLSNFLIQAKSQSDTKGTKFSHQVESMEKDYYRPEYTPKNFVN